MVIVSSNEINPNGSYRKAFIHKSKEEVMNEVAYKSSGGKPIFYGDMEEVKVGPIKNLEDILPKKGKPTKGAIYLQGIDPAIGDGGGSLTSVYSIVDGEIVHEGDWPTKCPECGSTDIGFSDGQNECFTCNHKW